MFVVLIYSTHPLRLFSTGITRTACSCIARLVCAGTRPTYEPDTKARAYISHSLTGPMLANAKTHSSRTGRRIRRWPSDPRKHRKHWNSQEHSRTPPANQHGPHFPPNPPYPSRPSMSLKSVYLAQGPCKLIPTRFRVDQTALGTRI